MTVGLAVAVLNAWLNDLATDITHIKLHTGDPGVGAGNAFGDTTRAAVTWDAAAGASIDNATNAAWTNLSAGGTISHVSFWNASVAGTFQGSATLSTPKVVASTDNFTIPAGSGIISITPVAA